MKASRFTMVSLMAILCVAMLAGAAFSEEIKAKIKSFDAASNTVVVSPSGKADMPLVVDDKNAANELKSGRIRVGTKVKVKYDNKGGKNIASSLKKLPGC
ncbi:MAG TPA: hypothetical protein VF790_04315 [Dissulfurispiraceae bacterium]